jgi:hypothetical protein
VYIAQRSLLLEMFGFFALSHYYAATESKRASGNQERNILCAISLLLEVEQIKF